MQEFHNMSLQITGTKAVRAPREASQPQPAAS